VVLPAFDGLLPLGEPELMDMRASHAASTATPTVLGKTPAPARVAGNLPNPENAPVLPAPRRSAFGLPCAKCGMYYESDLPACPICKSPERVQPRSVLPANVQTSPTQNIPQAAPSVLDGAPSPEALEEERERFLRELKAQLYQSPMKLNSNATANCARESVHTEAPGPAEICRDCYDHAQECADRMEGALHMDLKEAGKIIYDAVWADTSDPDKTYLNAAQALLNELRARAGISSAPSAPQKYSH
jgi:hypothetical protein